MWLRERVREKNRDHSSTGSFPKWPKLPRMSQVGSTIQEFNSLSTIYNKNPSILAFIHCFSSTIAGNWIRSKLANPKWQLKPHHQNVQLTSASLMVIHSTWTLSRYLHVYLRIIQKHKDLFYSHGYCLHLFWIFI